MAVADLGGDAAALGPARGAGLELVEGLDDGLPARGRRRGRRAVGRGVVVVVVVVGGRAEVVAEVP